MTTQPEPNLASLIETLIGRADQIVQLEPIDPCGVGLGERPVLFSAPAGRAVVDLTAQFDARRANPIRRRGTATAQSLDTLVEWAQRNHSPDRSVLFLDRRPEAPSLTAIANYHADGASTTPTLAGHCDHRCVYPFPVAREWKAWNAASGQPMDVPVFGEFIESRARDLLQPTPAMLGSGEPTTSWEGNAIEIAAKLGGRFATVEQMLALGRDFRVFVDSAAVVRYDRATGQGQVLSEETHKDGSGQPLKLPSLFMIRVPVFTGGDLYPVVCRFLYRARPPKLFFEIYDAEHVFDDAIDQAADRARSETDQPLFEGAPEKTP